jgi:hypothetical protein
VSVAAAAARVSRDRSNWRFVSACRSERVVLMTNSGSGAATASVAGAADDDDDLECRAKLCGDQPHAATDE